MKKAVIGCIALMLVMGCKSAPAANPDEVSLNTAIREAASLMETRLPEKTKIALINFSSPDQTFSEYVLDEFSSVLVNNGVLVVVDRASLDRVRQELNFNMSGEVSDDSAQEIGKMLGAEAIVTGRLTSISDLRRVMFKTIITETAAVAVQHPADIINDRRVQALLASGAETPKDAIASSATGAQVLTYNGRGGGSGTATEPAARTTSAAAPRNGTYTFWPRLQPYKGAAPEQGAYLHKITVRGEYMNIYLCDSAAGDTKSSPKGYWTFAPSSRTDIILRDLDDPSKTYNPEQGAVAGYSWNSDGVWFTFKGVTAKRFSLTTTYDAVPSTFEEIIPGEPGL